MKEKIKLEVPNSWKGVTLRDYLALRKDMDSYKDNEEAVFACLLHHLCGFPVQYLEQMDIDTYVAIKRDVTGFFTKIEHELVRFITIDGVEYGFEPNLSQMAYGAYLDIAKYENVSIDDKWADIMSILYRPVTNKMGALYDIEPYTGKLQPENFMSVTMDVHFGALFFLINLQTDLLKSTLKSSMEGLTEAPLLQKLKQTLGENGKVIHPLFNYHQEILPNLMKLPNNL